MLRLPRELRDEIYAHLFTPASPPESASLFSQKSHTLGQIRYRLTSPTEADEIRASGPDGCQTWPSRDGSGFVITRMLPSAIFQVSKQIGNEALDSLLATIWKKPTLCAPPPGTRISRSKTWQLVLQNVTIVDLVPFSWSQLQQFIPYLTTNQHLVTITVNFKRMVKSASPSSYPAARNIKTMLSQLVNIQAKEVEIIWYADLDGEGSVLTTSEKTLCRTAIDVTKACMTGKGTEVEKAWLAEYNRRYDICRRNPTSWDDFCDRIDVKAEGERPYI